LGPFIVILIARDNRYYWKEKENKERRERERERGRKEGRKEEKERKKRKERKKKKWWYTLIILTFGERQRQFKARLSYILKPYLKKKKKIKS
jgi:hypothetical protein